MHSIEPLTLERGLCKIRLTKGVSMEERFDMLMWAIGGGFAGTWAILFYSLKQIGKLDERLTGQIAKLDEKLTDVDRRLCRLEGAFASKDCCMIKDHRIQEQSQ